MRIRIAYQDQPGEEIYSQINYREPEAAMMGALYENGRDPMAVFYLVPREYLEGMRGQEIPVETLRQNIRLAQLMAEKKACRDFHCRPYDGRVSAQKKFLADFLAFAETKAAEGKKLKIVVE